jgi:hypothetical protein
MQTQRLIACVWLAAASTACGYYHDHVNPAAPTPGLLIGSGRVITEPRPIGEFTTILVGNAIEAVVTVGGNESLEITAEDNIAPVVDAVAVDGRLTLGFRPGTTSIRTSVGVVCRINTRSLRGVEMSSASRIRVDGLDARDFSVNLTGAASFAGTGAVDRLRLDLSGASRVTAPSLRAREVDAMLSGASVALVRVVDALVVHASGSSLFEYLGDPTVRLEASGGSVVRRAGS